MDKFIDLIKWCDTPKKIISLLVVGFVLLSGYLVYKNEQSIWMYIAGGNNHYQVKDPEQLENITKQLLIDVNAPALVVHKGDIQANERITILAQEQNGLRNKNIEGHIASLFNSGSNNRNEALIMMLRGEVFCADFKSSSKVGKWMDTLDVKYMCRVALPPSAGHFHGYMAVGFKEKPKDIIDVKQRIILTAKDLVK